MRLPLILLMNAVTVSSVSMMGYCSAVDALCLPTDLTCDPARFYMVRALVRPPALSVFDASSVNVTSGSTKSLGTVGRGIGGTYKDLVLRITNTGGQTLEIQNVTVAPSSQFSVITQPQPAIFFGSSSTMVIRYIPSAGASDSAVLTFTTNDSSNQTFTLNMGGNGLDVGTGVSVYFPLDGNLNDSSGNGFNGVVVGSIGYATGRGGAPSTAVALDGGGANYFRVDGPAGWAWNSTYSISAWVRTDQSAFSLMFRSFVGVCTTQLEYGFNGTAYQITRDSFSCGGWVPTTIPGTTTPGQWQHIAYVSNAGNVTAYLNGAPVGSNFISNANAPGVGLNRIQFGFGVFMPSLLGSMDDIRIYQSTALSAAQVGALYNQD